jgi:hypothetical protein
LRPDGLGKLIKFNYLTRDLPACRIVPQPLHYLVPLYTLYRVGTMGRRCIISPRSDFLGSFWLQLEIPTLLGPLERANLNHWKGLNRVGFSLPSPEDGNRSSFRNIAFSSIYNSGRWTKPRNLVILRVMHLRHNPFELGKLCRDPGSYTIRNTSVSH